MSRYLNDYIRKARRLLRRQRLRRRRPITSRRRFLIQGVALLAGGLRIKRTASADIKTVQCKAPNSPISTVERTIYRQRLNLHLAAGDHITLLPVPSWLDQPVSWTIPPTGAAGSPFLSLPFFAAAAMIFGGALSLALAFPAKHGSVLKT